MPPYLSIIIPSYNEPDLLFETLTHVLREGIPSMEVIVCDDGSSVDTKVSVDKVADDRVRWYGHSANVGYGANLNRALSYASGELVMLMGQDDIVLRNGIVRSIEPFDDARVAVVTRPYYWFYNDPRRPCRAVYPLHDSEDVRVTLESSRRDLTGVFWSIAQLSGLVYRRSLLKIPFHSDIFTAHVWPFLEAMKWGTCVSVSSFTIAVRIESSMTRHLSSTYSKSSLQSWIDVFEGVFELESCSWPRKCGIEYLTESSNFVSLVQIRNCVGIAAVLREIRLYMELRRTVIFNVQFVAFSVLSLVLPRKLLRSMSDGYKERIMGRIVRRRLANLECVA